MEQSPSSESNIFSSNQKIPAFIEPGGSLQSLQKRAIALS
jgi:hypothetical protein